MRFLENHDEPRSAVTFAARVPAAAALACTIPGMRFLFDGQQDGRRVRSPVQLARWPDEPGDARVRALYDAVLRFASKRVLHDGTWGALGTATAGDDTFLDILAYRWRTPRPLPSSSSTSAHARRRRTFPSVTFSATRDRPSSSTTRSPGTLSMDA